MAHTETHRAKDFAKAAAKYGAVGLATGLMGGAGITLKNHREETHRSVTLAEPLRRAIAFEQATTGVADSSVWAAVHRVHHRMTDGTMKPMYDISRAIRWMQQNPEKVVGVEVPAEIPHLDPFVDKLSIQDVLEIGQHAEDEVKQRMGSNYKEPENYTPEELVTLLHPSEPQYLYPDKKRKGGNYTQDEIADIILGDPHSPIRMRGENGVRGVASNNVGLYSRAASMFSERPDLKPEDLQREGDEKKGAHRSAILAGILIPSVAVLLKRGEYKPKDIAKATAAGATIWGSKVAFEIFGGNITNSYGHAGPLSQNRIVEAMGRTQYVPELNEDGTLAADTKHAGFLGTVLSRMTLDEVGGQQVHHEDPDRIAYTKKTGKEAFKEAPFGFMVGKLAEARWFPLIKPGKGFELADGQTRPDVPHPGMEIIYKRRAEQRRKNP